MTRRTISTLCAVVCCLGAAADSWAVIVGFDNLPTSDPILGTPLPANYANIAWDSNVRYFTESAYPEYSQPASPPNYIFNYGTAPLATIGFSLLDPGAYLIGAYFTKASIAQDLPVRMLGLDAQNQQVYASSWLTLHSLTTPQWLPCNFGPVARLVVEHYGSGDKFSMDSIHYDVPEPASLTLAGLALLALTRRARSRS